MRKKHLQISVAVAIVFAMIFTATYLLRPESAIASGCGPCLGPERTASGSGTGSNCSEAQDAAYQDALINAFVDAPECVPCDHYQGITSCYAIDPGGGYGSSTTIHYKCRTCDLGPEEPFIP